MLVRQIIFASLLIQLISNWQQANAQYNTQFDVTGSGAYETASITFSNNIEKDTFIEFEDTYLSVWCDNPGFTGTYTECAATGLSSGIVYFGLATSDNDQNQWWSQNCPSGNFQMSGDAWQDICAEISY